MKKEKAEKPENATETTEGEKPKKAVGRGSPPYLPGQKDKYPLCPTEFRPFQNKYGKLYNPINLCLSTLYDTSGVATTENIIGFILKFISRNHMKLAPSDLWCLCSQLEIRIEEPPKKVDEPYFVDTLKESVRRRLAKVRLVEKTDDVWLDFDFIKYQDSWELFFARSRLSNIVTDFATEYLRPLKPKNILYPWGHDPLGISRLCNSLPSLTQALAITKSTNLLWQADLFKQVADKILELNKSGDRKEFITSLRELKIGVFPKWVVASANPSGGKFPLLTGGAFPIIGMGHNKDTDNEVIGAINELKQKEWDSIICVVPDHQEGTIIPESAKKLSPTGVGFYVVDSSIFFSSPIKEGNIYDALERCGLTIESALVIPNPFSFRCEKLMITIKKGPQGKILVGKLQADSNRLKLLMENIETKQDDRDFALGMVVEKGDFVSYQDLKTYREYQIQLTRQGSPLVKLADLTKEVNDHGLKAPTLKALVDYSDLTNALYLPSLWAEDLKVVTSTEQIRGSGNVYRQLVLKQDLVSAEFLAGFLNSELGLVARRLLRTRKDIDIPLPALSFQSAVIEADTKLRDLSTDVENLRKHLWNRPRQVEKVRKDIERVNREETFEEWLKTLPFPLASILWNYHAATHDPKEQFELLLKFFEGLAEFNATILMSAARRDALLWGEVRSYLAKERERFETSSFGTWIELSAFISKRLRKLYNNEDKTADGDERSARSRCEAALGSSRSEVIEAMLSKEFLGVLRSANSFRNDYGGHYGVLGEETAASLLVQLRAFLAKVRSSFGQAWDSYQLLLPTNRSEWTGQHHEVVVNLLQGRAAPFLKERRKLSEPLKRNTLYLLDKDCDKAVELLPLLKISSAPKDADNACYFYNRKHSNGARYVSYHFEKKADMTFPAEQLFHDLFGN